MYDPPQLLRPAIPKYLTREGAAEYISTVLGVPISRGRLANLASEGGGPVFFKPRKLALYRPADLDAWVEARMGKPRSNTSEPPE